MGRAVSGRSFFASPGGLVKFLAHLPSFIKLYWRLFTDKRISMVPKAVLVLGLLYVVVPTDLIFDALLGLGQLDDVAVMAGALHMFVRLCPRRIVEEHVRLIDEGA